MDYYLFIARTITHAQRMIQVLKTAGTHAQIFRAPTGLTDRGCSYAVKVSEEKFNQALQQLQTASLQPLSIFHHQADGYKKVER